MAKPKDYSLAFGQCSFRLLVLSLKISSLISISLLSKTLISILNRSVQKCKDRKNYAADAYAKG